MLGIMAINKCKCGKVASNLIVSRNIEVNFYLCGKHTLELEKKLGEVVEPITTKGNLINGLFLSL